MPGKDSRWWKGGRLLLRSKGKDDDDNHQEATALPPAAEQTPIQEAAQREGPVQPEQFWDQAYDDLKHEEPKLFEFYETILSYDLDSSRGTRGNVIEQDRTKRRAQMDHLLNAGMDKTAKLAEVEKNIGDAISVVLSVKTAIGLGLQAVPIAALAWTGVCVVLEASSPSTVRLLCSDHFRFFKTPSARQLRIGKESVRSFPT
jgi:hypothetical protein